MTIEVQIGPISNSAENFRALVLYLAEDPLLKNSALHTLTLVEPSLSSGHLIVAARGGKLLGAVGWRLMSAASAELCVSQARTPRRDELAPEGGGAILTFAASREKGMLFRLVRHAFRMNAGRIVIFERHLQRGSTTSRFGWVDPQGKMH